MTQPPLLEGFSPTLLLILNLTGTFVFGLSGGMAGVRAKLDVFGAVVLGIVVGITGGTVRDLLIGIAPSTFRDWRYLAVAGGAGLLTAVVHERIDRMQRPIDALDAAGLGLFCVTGAATALSHGLGTPEAIILGAVTGIGGGMLRDILIRQVPTVLRGGLYAIPALFGAAIVVVAYRAGDHTVIFPIVGAAACFLMRMAGLRFGLGLPAADSVSLRRPRTRDPSSPIHDDDERDPPGESADNRST